MKRKVCMMLAALMALTGAAGCGSETKEETTQEFTEKDPTEYEGTLNIWSWTDDPVYQIAAFNEVYPNVKVEFTQIGEDYDVKMQTIVDNKADGPDIFCADVKTVKNYIELGAWDNLDAAPYNAGELTGDVIGYTKEVASDEDGNLHALSWQATPGGYWYKRSMAKEYLGTDNPTEVSEMLSTMDGLMEVAQTIYDKSGGVTAFMPNYSDLWNMACYAERTTPWVQDGVFQMDDYVDTFFDLSKQIRDNGFDAKLDSWSTAWYAAAADDSLFGYILPTWGMQYVIQGSAPDSMGDWAIASMPSSYFNGGTYMGIYTESKEKELAWEYLKFTTLNEDYSKQYIEDKADFPALQSVVDAVVDDYADEWCGGQNTFAFFKSEAEKIDASLVTKYDDTINNLLLQNVELYVQGTLSKEEAMTQFKEDVASAYQGIQVE